MDAYLMTSLVIVLGLIGLLALPWKDVDISASAAAWKTLGTVLRGFFR